MATSHHLVRLSEILKVVTGCFWPNSDRYKTATNTRIYTSVCSAISNTSSTSIPKYRTVLSNFVWPNKSWTALR